MMQNWLNSETDKLQMRKRAINRINNKINDFFENNQTLENLLNVKGSWGSGKTTVVSHLEENFNEKFNTKKVEFYMIDLSEYETIYNTFYNITKDLLLKITALEEKNISQNKNTRISKIKKLLRVIKSLTLGVTVIDSYTGLEIKPHVKVDLNEPKNEYINKDLNTVIKEITNEIKELIKETNRNIVIIFDELDRCTPENQIKFLSYIKNIFFKITSIFFIVSCNNKSIDSKLSLSDNNSESYTLKLFNKTIDLDWIIPSHRGIFTENQFIHKFIQEIYNNNKIILSPREINFLLEATDSVFLDFKNKNNKIIEVKAWDKKFFIYEGIEEEIRFIIFFCFYVKNKEEDFMKSKNFNLLLIFLKSFLIKETDCYNNFNNEKLMQLINDNKWEQSSRTFDLNIFLGWKDIARNKYSFHLFSLLPFILPVINDKNISNFFEKKITKHPYLETRYFNNFFEVHYTNILFKNEKQELPDFLILFLDIIWDIPSINYKNNISNISQDIRMPIMRFFNYKYIFNIIEETTFK